MSEAEQGASRPRSSVLAWLSGSVKLVALPVGGCGTLVGLSALVGTLTSNGWIQLGVGIAVALIVPLVLFDRFLPRDGSKRPGLLTDVVSVCWMSAATAVFAFGSTFLHAPLTTHAKRLDDAGWRHSAWIARWISGDPNAPEQAAEPNAPEEPEAKEDAAEPVEGAGYVEAPKGADRKALTAAELFATRAKSVVTIKTDGGAGTGFIIDATGTIATNNHVVAGSDEIKVKLFGGEMIEDVKLLIADEDADLALLRIGTKEKLEPLALGVSADIEVGEEVTVIGNPVGLEHTMTDGIVSSRRVHNGKKYIQISAPVSPGNSGGPVFNRFGDVVGVTVMKVWGENLNFAVPIDKLKPMIKESYPDAIDFGKSRW